MITYKDYLEEIDIVDEQTFNRIVESLPTEVDLKDITFDEYNNSEDGIAKSIIDGILMKYQYCYCDDVDFNGKTFELEDVDSLEELSKIKELFENKGWTIDNYDELTEDFETREEEDKEYELYNKKMNLLRRLSDKLSLEEIEKLVNNYDQK